jgi:prepilin-type N-terminal cleavage/methylation domain-containing protein
MCNLVSKYSTLLTQKGDKMVKKQAFTLIELLVVIAVIAVLMGILMPDLRADRELARGSNCMANQRTVVLAYTMYAGDNDSRIVRSHVDMVNLNSPMWVHSETWKIFNEDLPISTLLPAPGINEDWRWCWERFPYLHETEKPR